MAGRAPASAASVLDVGAEQFDNKRADALLEQQPELVVFVEQRSEAGEEGLQQLEPECPGHLHNAEEPERLISINQLDQVLANEKRVL